MRSLIRGLAAVGGTAALGLGAALAGASTPAHAAAPGLKQLSASCQTTTAGRACVALQSVYTGSAQQHYQAAFSLTPASGQYLKPVNWTTINPTFAGTDHAFTSGATNKPYAQVIGSMSQPSVIGFTFNAPGKTYHLYTGSSTGVAQASAGNSYLGLQTTYYATSNVVYARYQGRFSISGSTAPMDTPEYLRLFTRQNTTLYSKQLCPTGGCQPVGAYGINVGETYRYDAISKPVGIAALVAIKGTPTTLVAKTAA